MRKELLAMFGICMLLLTLVGCGYTKEETEQMVNAAATQATQNARELAQAETAKQIENVKATYQQEVAKAEAERQGLQAKLDAEAKAKLSLEAEMNSRIKSLELALEEKQVEEEVISNAYVIDELRIGDSFSEEFGNRKVSKLVDTKIKFDGEDYDVEEVMTVGGNFAANKEDFNGAVYMEVGKDDISYTLQLDADLDVSDITDEESLELLFLGESVEIVDWDGDSVTFTKGDEFLVEEGKSVTTADGKVVEFKLISDNYVYVIVDGKGKKIIEGDTKSVEDVEIEVKEVLDNENEDGVDFAVVKIGEEVAYEVDDGDDYDDDGIWVYVITSDSIGIKLNEDYDDKLGRDTEPFVTGSQICLPNNYVCMVYDGIVESKMVDLEFDTDNNYDVEVKGKFIAGLDDYDVVYINASGIYDEDDNLISASQVEIDDTDSMMLRVDGTNIYVDDVVISYALDSIKVGTTDISGFDETYVTNYGIVIDNPEDAVDDQQIDISVPEEEAEITVSII